MVFFVGGDPLAALPTSVKQKFGALLIDLLISRRFSPAFSLTFCSDFENFKENSQEF